MSYRRGPAGTSPAALSLRGPRRLKAWPTCRQLTPRHGHRSCARTRRLGSTDGRVVRGGSVPPGASSGVGRLVEGGAGNGTAPRRLGPKPAGVSRGRRPPTRFFGRLELERSPTPPRVYTRAAPGAVSRILGQNSTADHRWPVIRRSYSPSRRRTPISARGLPPPDSRLACSIQERHTNLPPRTTPSCCRTPAPRPQNRQRTVRRCRIIASPFTQISRGS